MDSGFLLTSSGIGLISSLVMQWMKKSNLFTFLGCEKMHENANLYFSIAVAFITSLGIGYKYDAVAGTVLITGLTSASLAHGVWHWGSQWVIQHVTYKQFIVPTELQAAMVNQLKLLASQLERKPEPKI